jgi:GNAT superfamily N-acetyltransferase
MLAGLTLLQHADRNLTSYLKHLADTATGGLSQDEPGFLLFAGTHAYPGTYTNGAIAKGTGVPAAELLARADDFFGRLGRSYVLWVRDHADSDLDTEARRRGLWLRPPASGNPCVVLQHPPELVPPAPGVSVRRIETEEDRQAYLSLVARSYQLDEAPVGLVESVLFSLASLRGERVMSYLALRGEAPVAGCMVYLADGAAGLQWVVTDPSERGKGHARAASTALLIAAFERGSDSVIGQSSQLGLPLWLRMGFRVTTHYRRYVVGDHLVSARSGAGQLARPGVPDGGGPRGAGDVVVGRQKASSPDAASVPPRGIRRLQSREADALPPSGGARATRSAEGPPT